MKLLLVLPEYGPQVKGGIATFYANLLPALAAAGCEIEIVVADPNPSEVILGGADDRIRITRTGSENIARHYDRLSQFAPAPGVRRALATAYAAFEACRGGEGYDVVETTDFGLLFVPWLCAGGGPSVVVQLHGSVGQIDYHDPISGNELSGLLARLLETALLGRAEELQSLSARNGLEWNRLLGRSVEHIPPGWDPPPHGQAMLPPGLDFAAAGIAVGRLQSWKGPEVLCQALGFLGRRAPTMYWIGRDHPYRDLNQRMSSHLKRNHGGVWGSRVVPLGEHPPDRVAAMQRAARFVVVPSIWDTFNLVAVESMWARKVVICSEGAGVAELIEHGANGFRFPAADARALANILASVASMSDEERDVIGARAQATVETTLDAERIAAARIARYRVIGTAGVRRRASRWGENAFGATAAVPLFGFLEGLPLRPLLSHSLRRSAAKLLGLFG